ncbi:PhoX family phosphatase [Spiractinospora alimapuensis]|uniref:PhoX family protein n=1 Tax=Spiractinospora alimapuensis TaxID=2820884 RepID=UPI001F1D5B4F|nr:PhoX family phosphatase [Spiractinospora alimapuensis]QVQ53469.1 PhoX family phosphatase [Spiractinospora alimapuensis]
MRTDSDDVSSNRSGNPPFQRVLAERFSRRGVLRGGTLAAAGFLLGGVAPNLARAASGEAGPLLGFSAVPLSAEDTVVVPDGYTATVFVPWGHPIRSDGPEWKADASNTAEEAARQFGSHHDGMHFFPLGQGPQASRNGLLVLNHEYVDQALLLSDGDEEMTQEKVDKGTATHGVSIVEVELVDGEWRIVDSDYNRRVTATTPVEFSGPVTADHPALAALDPQPRGTINNCSHGVTPWNTYLACEENFNNYFGTTDDSWEPTPEQDRYGIDDTGFGYKWFEVDQRFDIATNSEEANRFGWVVEIDPFDPDHVPVKRTALGRVKHEGAIVTEARGRVVVYTGDDQDGDYIYKFVGSRPWTELLATGRSPLDHGTLHVARFDDDGSGAWLPLTFGEGPLTTENGWTDQADVLLRARMAADALGATPMDRPEWIAVQPGTQDVYCSLTNGKAGEGEANPRSPNPYGHIIKWREDGHDNTATAFTWDIFLLAGDPAHDDAVDLDEDNMFGSPDGLWFDPQGRLWIQTDVSNSAQHDPDRGYDTIANNAMLAADPETGEVRRFLTGPRGAEISGVVTTPDQTTMFVNVQHPGEAVDMVGEPTPENPRAVSNWPDHAPDGRPRSATLVIRKDDGGVIGT